MPIIRVCRCGYIFATVNLDGLPKLRLPPACPNCKAPIDPRRFEVTAAPVGSTSNLPVPS